MLIGIKTDNIYKWDTSLKSMMAPTTTSLDQALLVIKKAIYEDKNIEYISDQDLESDEDDIYNYNNMPLVRQFSQVAGGRNNINLNMHQVREPMSSALYNRNQGLGIIEEDLSNNPDSSNIDTLSNAPGDTKKQHANMNSLYPKPLSELGPSDAQSGIGGKSNQLLKKKQNEEE